MVWIRLAQCGTWYNIFCVPFAICCKKKTNIIYSNVVHQVGPPGLYEIKCAKKDDDDYISAEENTQTRYFSTLGRMGGGRGWIVSLDLRRGNKLFS